MLQNAECNTEREIWLRDPLIAVIQAANRKKRPCSKGARPVRIRTGTVGIEIIVA